uniref:WD repeat-containing protein 55 homolog n=1 Tax=Acartia pacifica TaxID=335913 RepID=A0A0U2V641_ACAPC|nr:WD repeat-containing protein 55 [Acartia pacifica]
MGAEAAEERERRQDQEVEDDDSSSSEGEEETAAGDDDNTDSEDDNSNANDSDSDSDNDNDSEDVEESTSSAAVIKNPFFEDAADKDGSDAGDNSDDSLDDDDSDEDSDDSDSDSDDDGKADAGKEDAANNKEKADAVSDEDYLLNMLKSAREKKVRDCPPDVKLKEDVMDISFHPEEDLLAVSNIKGEISIFRYANEGNKVERKLKLHRSGIRCLEYSMDGTSIISGGKDKLVKLFNVETGKVTSGDVMSHPSPLYSLLSMENGAVSGDEDGTVKLWDFRSSRCVMTSKRFDEFVSGFYAHEQKKRLIASSGEGTIQSWDLRMNKPDLQSEVYDSELTCVTAVREETKAVVGSGAGILYLFNESEYGYHSDQFSGHPDAINHMVAVTDNVLITGCEDGILRAVHLYPHRFIGQVGHHEGGMPIEKLEVNGEGNLIASIGHDNRVKFWNISFLEKINYAKKRKPVAQIPGMKRKKMSEAMDKENEYQLPSSGRINKKDFFQGFNDS